jgi:hypothetical protein
VTSSHPLSSESVLKVEDKGASAHGRFEKAWTSGPLELVLNDFSVTLMRRAHL